MGDKPAGRFRAFSLWRLTEMDIALYGPMAVAQGREDASGVRSGAGGTPPAEFEADRARLSATIEPVHAESGGFEFRPHPMFGRMTGRSGCAGATCTAITICGSSGSEDDVTDRG